MESHTRILISSRHYNSPSDTLSPSLVRIIRNPASQSGSVSGQTSHHSLCGIIGPGWNGRESTSSSLLCLSAANASFRSTRGPGTNRRVTSLNHASLWYVFLSSSQSKRWHGLSTSPLSRTMLRKQALNNVTFVVPKNRKVCSRLSLIDLHTTFLASLWAVLIVFCTA